MRKYLATCRLGSAVGTSAEEVQAQHRGCKGVRGCKGQGWPGCKQKAASCYPPRLALTAGEGVQTSVRAIHCRPFTHCIAPGGCLTHRQPALLPTCTLTRAPGTNTPGLHAPGSRVIRTFVPAFAACSAVPWCRYDGPYRGVVELSGCGGGLRPFAKTPALAPEAIQGTWAAVSGVRVAAGATGPVPVHGERGEGAAGVFGDEGTEAGVAGARGGVVRLPLGLCLRWQVAGEGGAGVGVTIGLEAAALAAGEGAGRERAAGAARYVGGRLQHLAVGAERAQS